MDGYNLFKFIVQGERSDPDTEMGWYYINATQKKISKEVSDYLDKCAEDYPNYDYDFYNFIAYLKNKYDVKEYKVPFHYEIIY